MIDALTTVAASMSSDLSRMTSIGHNLANASTPGYKRHVAAGAEPFVQALEDQARAAGAAPAGNGTVADHKHGTLRPTGAALDVAIGGDGFFEVRTDSGLAYTRRGDFRVDATGQLVTHAGHQVMGTSGPLVLRSASPVIGKDGRVLDGEHEVGQLKIVHFAKPQQLTRVGEGGLFTAPEEAAATPEQQAPKLYQGHLEASNVNTASEMVKLIETVRHFEAMQKVVHGTDEMTERALRKLGEF